MIAGRIGVHIKFRGACAAVKLEGKTAIISGACGGIGRAIAERYAEEGATVVVTDRNRDRAARVAAEIGHSAYAVALDVTSEPSIAALAELNGACIERHRIGQDSSAAPRAGVFFFVRLRPKGP